MTASPLRIPLPSDTSVSALLHHPPNAKACFVFAHGAGAGMTHVFMQQIADGLATRHIATLRYQFPFIEQGSRRPDSPATAHACVRAAVDAAHEKTRLPLVAGGKSFGARMTSQAQAETPLPHVAALAFLGFPLHPAGKPSSERAKHLSQVKVPMLFVQGTRDKLADFPRIQQLVHDLGTQATLHTIDGADHGFDVLKRSGRTPEDVQTQLLDGLADWIRAATA